MIIATAGHVDHGKTSLVKALTGVDADRLPEEKKRGLTIDLGFVYDDTILPGVTIGFVDVPGHHRFIHNMLAGVTGVRAAMLIVAADDGPMPQTREHLDILELVGVETGVVALTKVDKVDAARVGEARREVAALLSGARLADAPILPVSSHTGEGLDALRDWLRRVGADAVAPPPQGNFRLAIDRAFSLDGVGVVATGLAQSGRVRLGDPVLLSPLGRTLRIRGLRAQNREVDEIRQGERCAVNLAGRIQKEEIRRGDWLVDGRVAAPSDRIDVEIRALASEDRPLRRRMPVHVHVGAADISGRIGLLELKEIAPGGAGLAQLALDAPVVASAGDVVVLRDQSASRTIAGGRVLDPASPRRGRSRPPRLAWLRALRGGDRAAALREILREAPGGAPLHALEAAWNLTEAEAATLQASVDVCCVGGDEVVGLSAAHAEAMAAAVVAGLEDWHRRHPSSAGPNELALSRALPFRCRRAAFDHVVARLVRLGEVERVGPLLKRRGHVARLAEADLRSWRRARPVLERADARPPTIGQIAAELGAEPDAVAGLLGRVAELGEVARISPNRFMTLATLRRLAMAAETGAAASESGRFTAAEFRDWSTLGRNLSIELLEYFDRVRFTRRIGDEREIMKPSATVFSLPVTRNNIEEEEKV